MERVNLTLKEEMTMSIKHRLSEEIEKELEDLQRMKLGSDEHRTAVDELTKLVDRYNEMEKLDGEREEKAANRLIDDEFKAAQAKRDTINKWIDHCIAIAGIVLPLAVTIWGTKASFRFEKEDSVTTIMGRGFVNKLLPKK